MSKARGRASIGDVMMIGVIGNMLVSIVVWISIYAVFVYVKSGQVLGWSDGMVASGKFLLSWFDLSLPQRFFPGWQGKWTWISIVDQLKNYPVAIMAIKVSTIVAASSGLAAQVVMVILMIAPARNEKRAGGALLITSPERFRRALQEKGNGINIHPKIKIARDRERRHLFLIGATGSGKTQIADQCLASVLNQGASVLAYDFKSDQTAKWLEQGAALLAPWDARGWAIELGADIYNDEHARLLAESIIPEARSDAMWAAAARIVATAAFRSCIHKRPGRWTFSDAMIELQLCDEELRAVVRRFAPEGARLVEDMASRTTQSIMVTLAAHLAPLQALADAWRDIPPERMLSLKSWLKCGSPRVVILQGNAEMKPLADVLHAAVFRTLLAAVGSPDLPESHSRQRWIFADEFIQLGKIPQLIPLLQTARSKGVSFVLATQDIPALRGVYGVNEADAIISAAGTVMVTGTNCATTAEWVSRRIGNEVIQREEVSKNFGRDGVSESVRWVEHTRPVLRPEEVMHRLGQVRVGPKWVTRALVLTGTGIVGLLDWPRCVMPRLAEPHVPADWLSAAHQAVERREPFPARGESDESISERTVDDEPNGEVVDATVRTTLKRRLIIRRKQDE